MYFEKFILLAVKVYCMQGYFYPVLFLPFSHLQTISPRLKFIQNGKLFQGQATLNCILLQCQAILALKQAFN